MESYYGYNPRELLLDVRYFLGKGEVLCSCPFHNDDSPSFCFNINKGVYVCYGCGARGGIKQLVRQTGGIVEISKIEQKSKSELEQEWKKLLIGKHAYDDEYLMSRKVTNEQIEEFSIKKNRDGIVIPLIDDNGKTCGVLLRKKIGKVRYLVIGNKPPLWPLNKLSEINKGEIVAIVEGVFGFLAANRAGINAVATLGANVKPSAIQYLSYYKPRIVFDDDFAGYLGAGKIVVMNSETEIVIPGTEADEAGIKKWRWLMSDKPELLKGLDGLRQLSFYSGDSKKFYSHLNNFRNQIKRKNGNVRKK